MLHSIENSTPTFWLLLRGKAFEPSSRGSSCDGVDNGENVDVWEDAEEGDGDVALAFSRRREEV
jgi:hypothetical protein